MSATSHAVGFARSPASPHRADALAAMLFTMAVWGLGPLFIRSLALSLGPSDTLVIRYGCVALLYLIGLAATGGVRIARADWPRLLIISLVGMVGYNLGSTYGFELVPAGVGGLIIGTQPLLIAVLGMALADGRPRGPAILGLIVAFAGTSLLFWQDLFAADPSGRLLLGGSYIFLSGIAWALYVVLSRPLVQAYGSFRISALSIIIATLPMLLLAGPGTADTVVAMTGRQWLEMAYLAIVSTLIAAVTWNYAAARLKPTATGAFLYLVPVIAVAAGWFWLGEPVTPTTLIGGALILLGVGIAQSKGPSPALMRAPALAAHAAVLFAVVMWGLVPVATRFLLTDLSPATVLLLRLYPTGVIAALVLVLIGMRPIEPADWPRILIAAWLGNVFYQVLAHFGIKTVPAAWTGMIFGLEPVFIALLAVLLAGERLTPWLIGGMALALLGTAALMLGSASGLARDVGLFGLVLVTFSTAGWGIYTVVLRPLAGKYGAIEISCLTLGLSALPMLVFTSPELPQALADLDARQWLAVGFQVLFATFGAVVAWNYGASRMTSARAGMYLYVQPLVAAAGGALLLDERITWPLIVGGGLMLVGVAVSQIRAKQLRGLEP